MRLYDLPLEIILYIASQIPMLYCCALVVTCAPQLIARGMLQPISAAELRAMHRLAYEGRAPRLGRRPSATAIDYFRKLPNELWMIVGSCLKTEDKLNFAAAIWQVFADQWDKHQVSNGQDTASG